MNSLKYPWVTFQSKKFIGALDVAANLWREIQNIWGFQYDSYTLKHIDFQGNMEIDDIEELIDERWIESYLSFDIVIVYDIYQSHDRYYVYFLVPTKYQSQFEWESVQDFKASQLPANFNTGFNERITWLL